MTTSIASNTAVTLQVKMLDETGKVLDAGTEPVAYLHGGYGNIFPKLEAMLEGQSIGFSTHVTLAAEDAFGLRDESLLRNIPKAEFPPGIKVGGQLQGSNDQGQPQVFNVVKIKGQVVMLDGNHPLAGKVLKLSLKVLDIRPASAEEIAHQHVHGAHGHQH
jgi:FKBP-type peptidyl-prolyl cis-trans isomerase SlyD